MCSISHRPASMFKILKVIFLVRDLYNTPPIPVTVFFILTTTSLGKF
ncbi:hypothetical protein EMIT0P260_10279 [Pseudomonas sp. IT-P260]